MIEEKEVEMSETVKYLTKEEMLGADDYVVEEVYVEAWGGTVRVKSLTGQERDRFESAITEVGRGGKSKVRDNVRAMLVAMSVVDANGSRVFSTKDVKMLGTKSAAALDTIFEVASRLSRVSEKDVEELTEGLEEILGESELTA